ncbi:MAG: M23 family metallopeptidase [Micrococcales bacterium]|nr:M23 family metallopeptidase [Micrococcales bacterium]
MSIGETITALALFAVSAVVTPAPTAPAARAEWAWPLDPRPPVVRAFDPPDQPWLAGHRGVDLATRVDATVHTPTGGRISFTGTIAGRGVVVVAHANGLRSTFEPVRDAPPLGTAVSRSEPIGTVGAAAGHCAPATCLHWGVIRGRTYLDPLGLLGRAPIILLPLS